MEPEMVPQETMPMRERPTVRPTRGQCVAIEVGEHAPDGDSQKADEPQTTPRIRPETISRRMISHQSLSFTSPTARARTTSVAACEPLLPPLEMMRGTNRPRRPPFRFLFRRPPSRRR